MAAFAPLIRRPTPKVPVTGGKRSPSASEVLAQPGAPLPAADRRYMESRFGGTFDEVRLHTGAEAARAARVLNARAFTSGNHIVFSNGAYDPARPAGRGLLAHELAHVRQGADLSHGVEAASSGAERQAARVGARVGLGLSAGPVARSQTGLALTPTSARVEPLISYSAFDFEVTASEEMAVLAMLRADTDLSGTIVDLDRDKMLGPLISRVDEPANRRALLQLLGGGLNSVARALVEPHVAALGPEWELQFNLGRFGVTAAAAPFNRAPLATLVSGAPTAPFTGAGATGTNPTTLGIPLTDQAALFAGSATTTAKYKNPITGPGGTTTAAAYLAGLTPAQRSGQASLLLRQPISSVEPNSYQGAVPSRAQVIRAAADAHQLEPALVAAIILAEQRDQSRNEDAADYLGATSTIKQGNTSIGLGQVVVSTAQKHDLFSDLLSSKTRSNLGHNAIARLLASDEHNIFAVAKYIRIVADAGARISIASLPNTRAAFPNIDMAKYAGPSSTWPADNIRALGSEYTSTAWDDSLVLDWAGFVLAAYQDVKSSGVF